MMALSAIACAIWLYLLLGHGRFWQAGPVLPRAVPGTLLGAVPATLLGAVPATLLGAVPAAHPAVTVVVPARDEAEVIARALRSLLAQDYAGPLRVILVDDNSSDGTGQIARRLGDPRLTVLGGRPRPAGWSGKLWAVSQGIGAASDADLVFLTDADIEHQPGHVSALVAKAERDDLDLVSEMVELSCDSVAERALVPAFVFFFQLLYPFQTVNNPLAATAAAAGGSILIRRRALDRIGGVEAVRGALIDDVALAGAVKTGGRIWLGHSVLARSIRPYPHVADIWRMIARTAYVQLRYSPVLLVGTVAAMLLVWLLPPFAALFGHGTARLFGLLGWAMLAGSYLPTLTRFRRSWAWAPLLPLIAAFYTAATIGSAINHYTGRGVAWKGRAYQGSGA